MLGRLIGLLSASLLGVTLAHQPAVAQQHDLKIGYVLGSGLLPLFVAQDKGLWAKHNIKAELIRLPTSAQGPAALVAGQLNVTMVPIPNLLQAVEGGVDLVYVSGVSQTRPEYQDQALIGRTGLNAKTAADMRGKKIGVPALFGGGDLTIRKWLQNHKVPLNEVTFVETPFPQMPDLLKNATIDAAVPVEPLQSRIISSGIGYVISNYLLEVMPHYPAGTLGSLRSWADANKPAVTALRAALNEAIVWMKANNDETRQIEGKWLQGNVGPKLTYFSTEMTPVEIKFFADLGKEFGLLRTNIDPNKIVVP